MSAAREALLRLEGVEKVKVDFMESMATITMKPNKELSEETCRKAIRNAADERGVSFRMTSFE